MYSFTPKQEVSGGSVVSRSVFQFRRLVVQSPPSSTCLNPELLPVLVYECNTIVKSLWINESAK